MSMSKTAASSSMVAELMKSITNKKQEIENEEYQKKLELLDNHPDQPVDEQGDAKQLGGKKLESGKQMGKTFREVYTKNKGYTEWTRQNVLPTSTKYSVPMMEFRLYVELRDEAKKERIKMVESDFQIVHTPRNAAQRRSHVEASWKESMQGETSDKQDKFNAIVECQEKLADMEETLTRFIKEKENMAGRLSVMLAEYEQM